MERRKFIAQVGTGTLASCAAGPVIANNLENSGLPLLEIGGDPFFGNRL